MWTSAEWTEGPLTERVNSGGAGFVLEDHEFDFRQFEVPFRLVTPLPSRAVCSID